MSSTWNEMLFAERVQKEVRRANDKFKKQIVQQMTDLQKDNFKMHFLLVQKESEINELKRKVESLEETENGNPPKRLRKSSD